MPPRQSSSLSFLPSMGKSPPKAHATPPPVAFSTPVLSSSVLVPDSVDKVLAPPSLDPPLLENDEPHAPPAEYGETFYIDDSLAQPCVYSSHGSWDSVDNGPVLRKEDSVASISSLNSGASGREPTPTTPKEQTPPIVSPNAPNMLSLAPPAVDRVMFASEPEDVDADALDALQDGDSSTPVVIPVRNSDFVPLFNYAAPSLQSSRSPSPPPPVDDRGQLLTKHNYHPAALPRCVIYKPSSGNRRKKVTFTAPLPSQPSLSPVEPIEQMPAPTQRTQGWVARESQVQEKEVKGLRQSSSIFSQKPPPRTPPKAPSQEVEATPQKKKKEKREKKDRSLLFTSPLSKGVVLSPKAKEVPAPTFSLTRSPESSVKEDKSPVFDDEEAPTFLKHEESAPAPTPTSFTLEKFEQSCDVFALRPPDLDKVDSQKLTPEVEVIPEQVPEASSEEESESLLTVARRIREKMRSPPQPSPARAPHVNPSKEVELTSQDSEYSVMLISPDKGKAQRTVIVVSDDEVETKAVESSVTDSNCNLATLWERRVGARQLTRQNSDASSPPTPRETPRKAVQVDSDLPPFVPPPPPPPPATPPREKSSSPTSSASSPSTPISPPPSGKRRRVSNPPLGSGVLLKLSSNSVVGKAFTPIFSTPPKLGGDSGDENVTPERQKIPPPELPAEEEEGRKRKKRERMAMREIDDERVDFAAATKECALCKINTDDTERLSNLGELMGGKADSSHPTKIRKCVGRRSRPIPLEMFHEVMYFHWHCLRYSNLSVDDHDTLTDALTEGFSTECAGCLESGATVKCAEPGCKKHYHLPCALLIPEVRLNNKKGALLCPDHRKKRKSA